MWIVDLIESPIQNDFRKGYFPRSYKYKKDAEILAKEVQKKGGVAKVTRNVVLKA